MSDVTQILQRIDSGDALAAEHLLPAVYDELRKLAAARMVMESPNQTLSATALVHEAWLRLVSGNPDRLWHDRRHFFAAAAQAMQRILVENARRKRRIKRGGQTQRVALGEVAVECGIPPEELLSLDEALARLSEEDAATAEVVRLRFFVGLSHEEAAAVLGVSAVTVKRTWRYARAWLHRQMHGDDPSAAPD